MTGRAGVAKAVIFWAFLAPVLFLAFGTVTALPVALLRAFVPPGEGPLLVEILAQVWAFAALLAGAGGTWWGWKRFLGRADAD